MPHLEQYGMVRVRHLLRAPEHYDGWRINQRAPVVGDIGTLLDIMSASGQQQPPVRVSAPSSTSRASRSCGSPMTFGNPKKLSWRTSSLYAKRSPDSRSVGPLVGRVLCTKF